MLTFCLDAANFAFMAFGRLGLERAREWWWALREWGAPEHNPFVAAAARVEVRRHLPFRVAFWWTAWFALAWFLAWAMDAGLSKPNAPSVVAGQTAISFAWLWALIAARLRLSLALQSEWLKARLVPILLSRLSPDEVAARAGAPAVWLGAFVAALGLPAWVFGLALGFLAPPDAVGYALLLAMSIIGFPRWSSALWEAQLNARARAKAGARPVAFNRAKTATTFGTGAMSLSRAVFWALFVVWIALNFSIPQPMINSVATWVSMWPKEITSLWTRPYAYPLMLARWLVYPLPFYALSFPVGLALAPFWVNGLRGSHARLSASLEARSDSLAKCALRIAAIWHPLRGWWAPLLLGFLLPVAYQDGWLGAWRGSVALSPTKVGGATDVTLSLWHALAAMATFAASFWLRARTTAWTGGSEDWQKLQRAWIKVVGRIYAGAFLVGTLAPLACGHNPFPSPFGVFAVQMALVVGTWLAVQWALAHIQTIEGTWLAGGNLGWVLALWFVGVPFLIAGVPPLLTWGVVFVNPLAWPMCLVSPVTLWFAPRFDTSLASPLFWSAALTQLALAVCLMLHARTLRAPVAKTAKRTTRRMSAAERRKGARGTPGPTLEQARQATVNALQGVVEIREGRAAPTRLPTRSASQDKGRLNSPASPPTVLDTDAPETAALRTVTRPPLPHPTPAQERFLRRFARFDNALLRLEMRRAMGQIDWFTNARGGAYAGVATIVVLSLVLPALYFLINLLSGGAPPRGGSPTFGGMEWVFFGLVMLGFVATSVDVCQRVEALYARDRLDGTLDFLWLSPMTTPEIVMGKVGPTLVRATLYFVAFWPALLTLAVLLSLAGDLRLWPFVVLLPPFWWALTVRGVAWFHLMGVAKNQSKLAIYASVVGLLGLLFPLGVGIVLALSPMSNDFDTANFAPLAAFVLLSIPLCLLDCALPVAWSLRLGERERVKRERGRPVTNHASSSALTT